MAACTSGSTLITALFPTVAMDQSSVFGLAFILGRTPESPRCGINNRGGLLILFTQPQADRQGVAQGDAFLGGFELVVFADGAEDGLVGAELFEAGQHLVAQRVGQVARAIARVARELREGEDRVAGLAAGRGKP